MLAKLKDSSWLWHFCFGQFRFCGLKTLQQNDIVIGLPQIIAPSQVCEECIRCPQFSKGVSWREKDVLELILSNNYVLINPSIHDGKRHLVPFTDNFSGKYLGLHLENEKFPP